MSCELSCQHIKTQNEMSKRNVNKSLKFITKITYRLQYYKAWHIDCEALSSIVLLPYHIEHWRNGFASILLKADFRFQYSPGVDLKRLLLRTSTKEQRSFNTAKTPKPSPMRLGKKVMLSRHALRAVPACGDRSKSRVRTVRGSWSNRVRFLKACCLN